MTNVKNIKEFATLPYRPCVGIMLVNAHNKIFVARRNDNRTSQWKDAWQMPQGGIDDGEDPKNAAFRELEEETNISADKVALIGQSQTEYFYDLPPELIGKLWKGKWRGQRQFWFIMRFLGQNDDINIATQNPEFSEWKWTELETLAEQIVPFKRDIYAALVTEFTALIHGK